MDKCSFWMLLVVILFYGCSFGHASHYHKPYHGFSRYRTVKLTTYNAALVTSGANLEKRKETLLKVLPAYNSDVMCIQEAWTFNDLNDIVTATKQAYPYSYSAMHNAAGVLVPPKLPTPACPARSVGALVLCLRSNCLSHAAVPIDFLNCMVAKCKIQTEALPQDCLSCLTTIPAASVFQPLQICMSSPFVTNYGLLVLSKKPLSKTKVVKYYDHLEIFPRAYLQAEVDGMGTVMCTHLTSNLSASLNLGDTFSSEKEQHLFEVKKLIKDAAKIHNVALMGDFNTGPALPYRNIRAEFGSSYSEFSKAGWFAPYVLLSGECTFCPSNPLRFEKPGYGSVLVDHIFVRWNQLFSKRLRKIRSKRVFDENVVQVGNSSIPMSDHYGVTVSFKMLKRRRPHVERSHRRRPYWHY